MQINKLIRSKKKKQNENILIVPGLTLQNTKLSVELTV